FEDAHGLHHHHAAGAVISGAGAGVPGIKMGAQHDQLVLLVFIHAGKFGDRVPLRGRVGEIVLDVEFQLHGLLGGKKPGDARPLLGGERDLRGARSLAHLVRAALLHEDGAAVDGAAAVIDHGDNFFVVEELVDLALRASAHLKFALQHQVTVRRGLVVLKVGQRLFAVALGKGFSRRLDVGIVGGKQDVSGELALITRQVLRRADAHAHDLGANYVVGSRSPGFGVGNKSRDVGSDHAHVGVFVKPAAAEGAPGLEMGIGEAEILKLLAGPVISALRVGRASEARTNAIHQAAGNLHDLGVAKTFVADLVDHIQVNLFLGEANQRKGAEYERKNGGETTRSLHEFSFE